MKLRIGHVFGRCIAACLTICMLLAMLPVPALSHSGRAAAADEEILYDFKLIKEEYGDDTTKMTYADTGDTWAFGSTSNLVDSPGYGVRLEASSAGHTLVLKLKIPKAGKYDITQIYLAASGGGLANVYLAPVDLPLAEAKAATYKIGDMDFYSAESKVNQEKLLGNVAIAEAGEYQLVYVTGARSGGWGNCVYSIGLRLEYTGEITPDQSQDDININFRDFVGKWPIRDLSLENNGFAINTEKTSEHAMALGDGNSFRIVEYGLQSQVNTYKTPRDADTAIDFMVKKDGVYRFSFDGGQYSGGAIVAIYVDDAYVGNYDMYSADGVDIGPTITTRSLELTEGKHTITFRSIGHTKGSWGYHQYIGRITLNMLPAMPDIAEIRTNLMKTEFVIGEQVQVVPEVALSDGWIYEPGALITGKEDTSYQVQFSSENPEVFRVNEKGKLVPLAAGKANLVIQATVGGKSKQEKIEITVSNRAIAEIKTTWPEEIYTGTEVEFAIETKLDNG